MVLTRTCLTQVQFPNHFMSLGIPVSHLSQECPTYTPLFPHVLAACWNCHTFTSGITTAKSAGYRNKCLSSTLAFQSHKQFPCSKSSRWLIPKHKINIIPSNWDNDTAEVAHQPSCSTTDTVQSVPLNHQTH